jgi:ribosomal protein S18 acetylase RimI-like enzyme
MAVTPERQRQGIGRLCIDEARRIARKSRRDAIRLDAQHSEAGAGECYRECSFRVLAARHIEVRR